MKRSFAIGAFESSPSFNPASTLLGATVSRKAAARYLGRSSQILANWATNDGRGLRYFVINGRAMYRMDDLLALANSDVPGYVNVSGEVAQ